MRIRTIRGNTVGSLTEDQKSIMIGCLLGDGYMRKKINAHLEINHAYSQKRYVDWKYRKLQNLVLTPPIRRNGNGKRIAYRFTTRSLPEITKLYQKFYRNGRKNIPKDLFLNPLVMAVWFMDDGSKSYKTVYLNTQQFAKNSQLFLINILKKQWNIEAMLNKDKEYYRIRIFSSSIKKFLKIIRPYILKQFYYKLPL